MIRTPVWSTNVGIELTFLPPRGKVSARVGKAMEKVAKELTKHHQMKSTAQSFITGYLWDVSCDQGALEISMPVLKSMEDVKTWYTVLHSVATEHNYRPHHKKHCSGGGHIHFDTKDTNETLKMYRDFCNRPYLNWFFNDDSDYFNGCNPWYVGYTTIHQKERFWFREIDKNTVEGRVLLGNNAPINWLPRNKCYGMKYCGDTHLEARFFRAPEDWPEQQAHIEFMQAWLWWVRQQRTIKTRELKFENRLKEFSFNTCIREFRKMVAMLELDWRNYERFVPNFESRWNVYGPDYLT
jgi:hypothetical protein